MAYRPHLSYQRWDGVFGAEFTLAAVRARVRGLSQLLATRRWSCLVAFDTRFMATQYALDAYRLLATAGANALFCAAPAPLPAVELALEQRKADCALVVTAGNRPYWFSGLMLFAGSGGAPALDPAPEHTSHQEPPFPPLPVDAGERGLVDLRAPYVERLRSEIDIELVRRAPLTLFVDPMNGAASGYLPAVLGEGAQARAIEINREVDALFGRQTPQPSEVGLNRMRKLVKESDSHFGVAISADGRALGVADHIGDMVAPLDLALLLARYMSAEHRQRGLVLAPAGATEPPGGLQGWEESTGIKVELSPNVPGRIAELVARDRNGLLAAVSSAGEVTLGRYGAVPDGTLAALVLAEITARYEQKLRPLVEQARGKA
jgi:phosphomannomutase